MGVRITWNDLSFGEDGHKIYRSTSPMDPESLPTPLDTVGANVTYYDDGSVVDGQTYYYRVSAYVGSEELVSAEVMIEANEFTPAELFASSQVGAWYDANDISTLWTDTSGTTQVSSDGDLVARVDDKSGNGYHLTQATSTYRPVFRTNGTKNWLEFDGVDDILEYGSNDLFRNIQSGLIGFALKSTGNNPGDSVLAIFKDTDGSTRALIRTDPSSTDAQFGGRRLDADTFDSFNLTGTSFPVDTAVVAHYDYANAAVHAYFDDSLAGEDTSFQTAGATSDTASYGFGVGGTPGVSARAEMDFYEMVIVGDSSHSAQQITDLSVYLKLKTQL